jgi:hypothetical protein
MKNTIIIYNVQGHRIENYDELSIDNHVFITLSVIIIFETHILSTCDFPICFMNVYGIFSNNFCIS